MCGTRERRALAHKKIRETSDESAETLMRKVKIRKAENWQYLLQTDP